MEAWLCGFTCEMDDEFVRNILLLGALSFVDKN
jgi:hypothetical protein